MVRVRVRVTILDFSHHILCIHIFAIIEFLWGMQNEGISMDLPELTPNPNPNPNPNWISMDLPELTDY